MTNINLESEMINTSELMKARELLDGESEDYRRGFLACWKLWSQSLEALVNVLFPKGDQNENNIKTTC